MNFEIHTLYYKNSNPIFFDLHSKIMKKFKKLKNKYFKVIYEELNTSYNIPVRYTFSSKRTRV